MTISFDKVAQRVFQILKGRGYSLKMYQDNGQRAFDPSLEARKFFVEDEGIMVAINKNGENSEIKVYISEDTKLKDIETLLISLRQTANFFGLLYNVRKYGKRLTPKEFAFLAYKTQREEEDEEMTESVKVPKEITRTIDALLLRELTPKQVREELSKFEFAGVRGPLKFVIDEYIQEGYRNLAEAKDTSSLWGTSQSSYQRVGSKQARLVVRHSQPVDEDKFAARSRHISKIFIENADGERIRFPTNYLQGARAMTRHVSMGGNFNDAIGEHIQYISEEYAILRKFKNNAGRKLGEPAMNVIGLVRNRGKEITAEVKGMQGPKSYKRYVENFEPKGQSLEEDIVMLEAERIRKIFDSATPYDGIDEAYIAVARLSRMNEDFDNIAEMIESGNISFTPKRDIRSGVHTNRNSAMLNKLYDLAERATDSKVSGFISRVAEKITNEIPMERTELNLVKGIVGIAEGTAIPVVEALDEFIDWADSYILEGSPYLDKPRRSEEEARADVEAKKKKDAEADSRWKKNQKTEETATSPYLDKPLRSEEEARADIEKERARRNKEGGMNVGGSKHKKKDEDDMEEGNPHWKKGRSRYNKQTKSIRYRKDEARSYERDLDPNRPIKVHGVRGVKSKEFTKRFKNLKSYDKWLNDFQDDLEIYQVMNEAGTQEADSKTPYTAKEKALMARVKASNIAKAKARTQKRDEKKKKTHEEFGEETIEQELEQRSTDSLKSELSELASKRQKGWKFQKIEKELHDRNINETTDNIIRFQELAGIQKKTISYTKLSEADPYGGSMISPYDDEPSDNDINRAHEEADYHISTEPINANDPDEVSDLRYGTERYLDQIGLGNILSNEDIDATIQRYYPTSELSTLKTDLVKDPILKTQFKDDPKDVIQKYQKRDS